MAHRTSTLLRALCALLLCATAACGTRDGTGTDTDAANDVSADGGDVTTDAEDAANDSDAAAMCPEQFPEFADDCTFAGECIVAIHEVDCCGSAVAIGIRGEEREAFNALEAVCRAESPICACAALETIADDGRSNWDASAFAVTCVDNACFTFLPDSPIDCSSGGNNEFPTFDRTCAVDTDCGWGMHMQDCCGTQVALGMAANEVARFGWAEQICGSQTPDCQCAPEPTLTDDGQTVTDVGAVVVVCDAGMCGTTLGR